MTDETTLPRNDRAAKSIPSLEGMGIRPEECGVGHPHIDARALDRCRLIVQRIEEDPKRFKIALRNLDKTEARHGRLSNARAEWREILKRPWAEIRAILLAETDEGQRLRSSHPFYGIITQEESREIMGRHPPPWTPPDWTPPPPPSPEVVARLVADDRRSR